LLVVEEVVREHEIEVCLLCDGEFVRENLLIEFRSSLRFVVIYFYLKEYLGIESMDISSSNFHQRQIPFEFRSPHDGTVDPLEVKPIPFKDLVMVRIHKSEIQPVPILVTYQMAKVIEDFPVDSKNQILHGD
jgi:hypothetical protein